MTAGGAFLADELSYDIFSQAAQAVMNPIGVDPLDGLEPKRIIASGTSQSAARMGIYYNRVHPLADVFDGFMLVTANPAIRSDLAEPAFILLTETDALHVAIGIGPGGPVPPLQPDTNTLRTWQVAGSSHLDATTVANILPLTARDGIPVPPPGLCTVQDEGSRARFFHVANAAYDHLARWADGGAPPPTAPPIQTAGPMIVRDARGLALGGIRLADQEVPIAVHTGENTGPFFCFLLGASTPFDQATLDALYPNHGVYVVQVDVVARANLADGFITRHDAQETITGAARSAIGR